MSVREILQRFGEKGRERQAMLKAMETKMRFQKIAEDRTKSANQRELERYMDEDRESSIKEQLEYMRKKRDQDIKFGHNPLDTPNITNHTEWEVMKEKNQFSNTKNMFMNQQNVLKSSKNLLKNHKKLFSGKCTI